MVKCANCGRELAPGAGVYVVAHQVWLRACDWLCLALAAWERMTDQERAQVRARVSAPQ
jgi:ribosomal protein L24E